MAGRGGGPSRRSHTKSRKGCKTCKRRHIRCDESFPQCRNCTKHHVKCDYMDYPPESEDNLRITIQPGLNWTPEIEKAVKSWQQTGQFPFMDLELSLVPQVTSFSKNEIRLLYHVCSVLSELKQSRTLKLSVWSDIMPKCLAVAAVQPLAMHAVFAFSASIMSWETQSTAAKAIAAEYLELTTSELRDAMSSFSKSNFEGVLTASLILSWLHNDWRAWTQEMSNLKIIMNVSQQFRPDTIFEEYLASAPVEPLQPSDSSSFPEANLRLPDNNETIHAIQASLRRLQAAIQLPEDDQKLIKRMDALMDSFLSAPMADGPKDQFERLYNLRKMLFWLPVNLLLSRHGDIHSLLVLSHYYATALALETVFPDIGAPFLASLAASPLEQIIKILQACQITQIHDPLAQAAAALLDFPQDALAQYGSRRSWAVQRAAIQAQAQAQAQVQQFQTEAMGYDLINQLGDLPIPQGGMSPAFPPSMLLLTPPPISAQLPQPMSSPFLAVPGNIVEQYAYKPYTPTSSSFHTPTTGYEVSPLVSPAFLADNDSSYHLPLPDYTSRRVSAEFGDLNVASLDDYALNSSSGVYQSSTASLTGGCVVPTAMWT